MKKASPEIIFLLTEGTLQPPPVLTQSVLDWISSVYASFVKIKVESKLKYEQRIADERDENQKKALSSKSAILKDVASKIAKAEVEHSTAEWQIESYLPWGPWPSTVEGKDWDWHQPFITIFKKNDSKGSVWYRFFITGGSYENAISKKGNASIMWDGGTYANTEEILSSIEYQFDDEVMNNWEQVIREQNNKITNLEEILSSIINYVNYSRHKAVSLSIPIKNR